MKLIDKLKEKQIKNQPIVLDLNIDNKPTSLRIMQKTIDYYMAIVLDKNLSEYFKHAGEIFNRVENSTPVDLNMSFFPI